jgi:hypothetical protein
VSADVVSGYRQYRADPWYRIVNARLYGAALRLLLGLSVADPNCAFKLYRRAIFDRIVLKSTGALINAEIFAKIKRLGYRVATVPVTHRPRTAGRQTGAQGKVIGKAMLELWSVWWDLRNFKNETA